MKTNRTILTTLALAAILCCGMATASASDVEARLSAREAYVGMPVVLQILINNAEDYEQPMMPEIDGCDVRSAGVPSQSSQITIINGRRSASRSITMQYFITPRRAGTFEIPSITVNVDGRDVRTRPQRFVATKSDTGDLMFAEIEGGKDKVFVGQPLDLTLKIWIKPYRDREQNITLSEANMWQLISNQTSWGSFANRLQELAENNQRPGGQEVLRDDGQGQERSYYLYEIKATVYPKRPGKIDADDVQIVLQYPTALGQSRDPFENFFKDSPFGSSPFGNSRLSQMMDDDFFSSPFGNRLTVSAARPIVAGATVDSTEVIPVPTAGRPADYRGAVGQYKIITQATPKKVNAGDPITLKIGIVGTGPMELVQAPPLAESSSLTADFKVNDEPLAGFVQDDTKVFTTTIRPRREGVAQIPPISFSFFDPDSESFQTVMSEPISISVAKADSLALSDIVGAAQHNDGSQQAGTVASEKRGPDVSNDESASVLVSQTAPSTVPWWWLFIACPPAIWLATLLVYKLKSFSGRLPSFKSPMRQCLHDIGLASEDYTIAQALTRYISRRTGIPCSDPNSAVGALRTLGLGSTANNVESFFSRLDRQAFSPVNESTLDCQKTAQELVEQLEPTFADRKLRVRRKANRATRRANLRLVKSASRKLAILLFVGLTAMSAGAAWADESPAAAQHAENAAQPEVVLTPSQQETILQEANQAYTQASQLSATDSAEAKDRFSLAAEKYQLLVNSGIHNSRLYLNLGNAYLQSGKLGHAIANYERGRQLDPDNRQLSENLDFVNSLAGNGEPARKATGETTLAQNILTQAQTVNQFVVNVIGSRTVIWLFAVSSLLFWGILIARACYPFPVWRFAIVPLLILLMSAGSYGLSRSSAAKIPDGVIVVNETNLHAGDGEQFDVVGKLETAQGLPVEILAERGSWFQVRTATGDEGWIHDRDLEVIKQKISKI